MIYAAPGADGAKISTNPTTTTLSAVSGRPSEGRIFRVITPITGKPYTKLPAPARKTSNWPWTPPMPPPTNGARPRPPSVPTCC